MRQAPFEGMGGAGDERDESPGTSAAWEERMLLDRLRETLQRELPAGHPGATALAVRLQGPPVLSTLLDVARALGLRLEIRILRQEDPPPAPPGGFLRHRQAIRELVRGLVQDLAVPEEARRRIQAFAHARLPEGARKAFLEVLEAELGALHEGDCARYGLTPLELATWKAYWR